MVSAATRAQQKAQKKKVVILVIMALATAMTWGKNLFGKDTKDASSTPTVAAAPVPGAAGGAGPTPPTPRPGALTTTVATSITSYDQAVQRMKTWPKALKRRVHVGQIEEILPFEQEVLDAKDDTKANRRREGLASASNAEEVLPEEPPEPQLSFEDLRLKLTTTAVMGKSRYARINGEKVTVGQVIEVQVGSKTIRYEVSAINPREVEIRYSGETYFLRITVRSLHSQAQDSA